ncbi:MAG TPA: type IV pilus modification protein PilV [Burkholderiaceae bacterium]|jgi:type IV pilus assembly protein PilV|nr:type IV pilus modification protein PilV [Burkholderiaceae bacterium]
MRVAMRGMSLIEVLVAMTIFAFGILGLLGMHARALSGFSDAKYRTDAALLTDGLINNIWVNRTAIGSYAYATGTPSSAVQPWLSEVQSTLPKGAGTVAVNGTTVTVTVTWQPPAAAAAGQTHQHVEIATIQNP